MHDFCYPQCNDCKSELEFLETSNLLYNDTFRSLFRCPTCRVKFTFLINMRTKLQALHKILN